MDIELYLKQLRAERDRVDSTIAALEAMAGEQAGVRTGPSSKSAAPQARPKRLGRRCSGKKAK